MPVPDVHFERRERTFVAEGIYFVVARFEEASENLFGGCTYYQRLAERLRVVPRKLYFRWKVQKVNVSPRDLTLS